MKNLKIINQFIPLDSKTIFDFQMKYSIAFPDYFSDFLIEYNGAETHYCIYRDKYVINNFLPLLLNRNASIELILPAIRNENEDICRNDLIPFAIDPGGRPYYLSFGDKDYGAIYIDRVGLGDSNPLLKISESFEKFINELEPDL
jgi:hypothetical protein